LQKWRCLLLARSAASCSWMMTPPENDGDVDAHCT
jgi:hypothetical protein